MQLTTRIFPCQRARCQSSFVAGGRPSTPQPAAPPRPARRSRSWCASHVLPQLSVDLVLLKQHEASPGAACSAGGPEAVLFETVLQQASALLKFESESHIRRDSRSSSSADPPPAGAPLHRGERGSACGRGGGPRRGSPGAGPGPIIRSGPLQPGRGAVRHAAGRAASPAAGVRQSAGRGPSVCAAGGQVPAEGKQSSFDCSTGWSEVRRSVALAFLLTPADTARGPARTAMRGLWMTNIARSVRRPSARTSAWCRERGRWRRTGASGLHPPAPRGSLKKPMAPV